jgi:hydroxyacylglutathione hydrolase
MALVVKSFSLGQLGANCYIIFDKLTHEGIILDPGDEGDFIFQELEKYEVRVLSIVASHGHFDHILAASHLQLVLNTAFLMNKKDEFLLERMAKSSSYFTGIASDLPPIITQPLTSRSYIKLGKEKLRVIETPGHTPGSISLYSSRSSVIFVGDLIFSDGSIGRYDFEYSSKPLMIKNIKKVLRLPKTTTVYSGHGDSSTLGSLKKLSKAALISVS